MSNSLQDININIKATNTDLKATLNDTRAQLHRSAKSYGDVGRSITSGISEPIRKANMANKDFQQQLLKSSGALEQFVGITESGVHAFSALAPQIGKAVAMYRALSVAQKATVIGAAVGVITLTVAAFHKLNQVMSVNSELQKAIAGVNLEARKSIVEQKITVDNLTETLIDYNSTLDERKKALAELNKISPEYFGNLSAENVNATLALEATDKYTAALLRNAKAKAAQEKIIELEKRRLDIEDEAMKKAAASGKVYAGAAAFTLAMTKKNTYEANNLAKEYNNLGIQIAKLAMIAKEGDDGSTSKKAASNTNTHTQAIKKKTDAQGKAVKINILAMDLMEKGVKIAMREQEIMGKVSSKLEANTVVYQLNNDALKMRSSSLSVVQSAIRDLISKGYTPESDAVQKLIAQYSRLNEIRVKPDMLPTSSGIGPGKEAAGAKILALDLTPSKSSGTEFQKWVSSNSDQLTKWSNQLHNASVLAQSFGDVMSNIDEGRMDKSERYWEREIAYIERSKMSETKKAEKILELERRRDAELRAIQRKQAVRAKAIALLTATINTAASVTALLANPAMAIAAGIAGAAQIAVIASEPIPALAKGGMAFGPTMAVVGDNLNAKVDPEVISPLSELKKHLSPGETNINLAAGLSISTYDLKVALERVDVSRSRLTA